MEAVRRAVIDVGTNSVKLLVADVFGHDVRPIHEESRQTRLGSGFYENRQLQPDSVARTAAAVSLFCEVARQHRASAVRVIATSAARDARNPADLTNAIQQASGLPTEVLSGACEAEWAFRGAATDPGLALQPLLLLDVGGGSTEFILGRGPVIRFAQSFPLGTVRLMEASRFQDPPTPQECAACLDSINRFLSVEICPHLLPGLAKESGHVELVGTGGTTSILARIQNQLATFDRDAIEKTVLTLEQVVALRQRLWQLPLARRQQIVGLPKQRADVILSGVLIYEAIMTRFGFPRLRISTRGLRFAAVMDTAAVI